MSNRPKTLSTYASLLRRRGSELHRQSGNQHYIYISYVFEFGKREVIRTLYGAETRLGREPQLNIVRMLKSVAIYPDLTYTLAITISA